MKPLEFFDFGWVGRADSAGAARGIGRTIAVATSDGAEASQKALPESVFEPLSVS
jgi:hypothetical protein